MIQLIACDLDGTLLLDDHTSVSDRTKQVVRTAQEQGIHFVISTGRMLRNIPEEALAFTKVDYAVTSNGAAVWDLNTQSVLYGKPMDCEVAQRVVSLLQTYQVYFEMYFHGNSYAERRRLPAADGAGMPAWYAEKIRARIHPIDNALDFILEQKRSIEKINVPFLKDQTYRALWDSLAATGEVALASSLGQNIEINTVGANKGDALRHLCARLGVDRTAVMAIGDSGNDAEMLGFAGYAVAMGNATPEIKALAEFVAPPNTCDGVAVAIEQALVQS